MNLRISLSVIFICLLNILCPAQDKMDKDRILKAVIDINSPYYYPGLESRYNAGDTTLTVDDYFYLYYGFAYQDRYKPLEANAAEDKILNIISNQNTPEQAAKIIEYGTEVMKKDPFSPKNINFMVYAYSIVGDTTKAIIYQDKLNKIIAAIKSSGTGLKENSPWHVLFFAHSTDILASMDLMPAKRMIISKTVEYIPLLKRVDNTKGYYFDFGRVYWKKPDTLPEKRSGGFQINGIQTKPKAK